MSFKLAFLLALVVSLTACDRFLHSHKEDAPAEVVKIEFKDGECLKTVPQQLQKFLSDQDGLGTSIPCVQTALKSFMRLTKGSEADSYKAKELQEFFNIYLLKENKISNEFQDDIMKIKVLVVGGSSDIVTRTELEKFGEFLGLLETELNKLKGRVRILTFKADRKQVAETTLPEMKIKLTVFADFVLKNTKLMSSQYQWSDLLAFLNHLHGFLGEVKDLDELLKWMPLTDSAKNLFLGESSRLFTQKDWVDSKTWLINGFMAVLKFQYQMKDGDYHSPAQWVRLVSWVDELFVVLETAPVLKEKKVLDATAIDRVIDEVYRKKLVQTHLSEALIKETYRKVLAYFVEAAPGSDPLKINGLTEEHIRIIKSEYNMWKAVQVFANRTYLENEQQDLSSLRIRFKTIDNKDFPAILQSDRPEYDQAWKDFYILLSRDQTIVFMDSLKLQVDYQKSQTKVPFVSVNMLNAVRSLSRFALRGYGNKDFHSPFQRRITKQRMMDLEENFREFGRAIGFFDPDKTTAGKETFDQANLLVFHSNGDKGVDGYEMTEVLSFLISGGQFMLDEIYKELAQRSNCLLPESDVFHRPWVQENCFVQALREKTDLFLDHLPEAAQFFKGLTNEQFIQAYKYLIKVAVGPRHRAGQLDSGEIRTMATILHFVEAIVMMYDKDQSGLLTQTEVSAALPRFHDIIEEQALKENFLAGFFLEDIFLYLVYEGERPSGALDITGIKTKKFLGTLGEVDKLKILKLLAVMKEMLANAPQK